jgi:LmbE family N-acetylglucosaminyl deacetylase
MQRRAFLGQFAFTGGALANALRPNISEQSGAQSATADSEAVFIERPVSGKPHAGKVVAAIQPHCDDIPIFAGGTVAKLIAEGYTGYLIRTTNDEMAGIGSVGQRVLDNERDTEAVARALGLQRVFNLEYRNHIMDVISRDEMRERMIYLIRFLKIDTIVCYDPWGHYEENPDHYVTAQVVEAACWMAAGDADYPEHFAAGLQPHAVQEKYYFARGPQLVNRIVDIGAWIDRKVEANVANKTKLATEKRKLALLGDNDDSANRAYIKHIVLDYDSPAQRGIPSDRELGQKHGLEWAEAFHYIGPRQSKLDAYISSHALPL